jgi:hypothetical protein
MTRVDIEGARPPVALRGKQRAVHLVILVETTQETLVDGVQLDDEKLVHWSIMARHRGPITWPE